MARSISASVGARGGVNRPNDVRTVQQLLNQVPPTDGGPKPLLAVDGICGPKTRAAIQGFQLHHFGWKGADGRVDPEGPTLVKLNEYDRPQRRCLTIRRIGPSGDPLDRSQPAQWFFEIRDTMAGQRAVYHLGTPGEARSTPTPAVFVGAIRSFTTFRSVDDLETHGGRYLTRYLDVDDLAFRKSAFSCLDLTFLGTSHSIERLRIFYPDHLKPSKPSGLNPLGRRPLHAVVSKHGVFVRVR